MKPLSRIWKLSGSLSALAMIIYPAVDASAREVRFDRPAGHFTESLPLGNGRLGAMIFGGVGTERIVLNESGMWSGSPQNADRPDAAAALPEIRRLLLEGKNAEAEALVNQNFTCAGEGSGRGRGAEKPYGSYQVLGNLYLEFDDSAEEVVASYGRVLDLETATARLDYTKGGVAHQRRGFVSAPDNVFVYELTADIPHSLNLHIRMGRPERATAAVTSDGDIELHGELPNGWSSGRGVRFAARVRIADTDGELLPGADSIHVTNASRLTLLVSAATDIRSFAGRPVEDARRQALADLDRLDGRTVAD
ncbi:MAG TPA: glycoside hydrolase family 95 protein, partial [Oceanipulchritudo sp.]|nr:glycoside hydrolase family 95 protein [Oceanipulchritudo sp.]